MALYHGCLKSLITSCRCSKILSLFCVWCLLVLLLQSPLVQSTSLTSRFLFSFYVYVSIRYGKYFLCFSPIREILLCFNAIWEILLCFNPIREILLYFSPIREILLCFSPIRKYFFYVSIRYGKYFYVSIQYGKYFLCFNPIWEILLCFNQIQEILSMVQSDTGNPFYVSVQIFICGHCCVGPDDVKLMTVDYNIRI